MDIISGSMMFNFFHFPPRIVCAMGCSHGCGEAQRGNHPDSVRSHAQNLLLRLTQRFRTQFSKYFENLVMQQSLSTIMEFFHALCSFCADSASLLSPMSKEYILFTGLFYSCKKITITPELYVWMSC